MTNLLRHHLRLAVNRDGLVGRRHFLQSISLAGLASGSLAWTDGLSLHAEELRQQGRACILLWMQGGPSQLETFDPKPGHTNGGETKAIATNVAGIQFADNLPKLAQVADRLAVVRSMTTREGEHQRATYLMHTSYLPTASVKYPAMGAIVAHEIKDVACELPAFVRIGGGFNNGGNGGFLGSAYDPLTVGSGGRAPENTRIATDAARFRRRLDLQGRLQTAAGVSPGDAHQELYADASRMILSPQMDAFNLELESAATRDAYGRSQFGASCLLARRLVESGVTFVEASIGGWDTHDNNFARSRTLCEQLDQPFAALVEDLDDRGMLDKTLVVWMGEFGRTPRINPRGGRDHFPRAFSTVLAGGGIKGGRVIGATDASGETVTERPVTEKDIFQTVYKSLGINGSKENMSPIGRPIKLVDGGKAVDELFT
jgi:hypothetical protein